MTHRKADTTTQRRRLLRAAGGALLAAPFTQTARAQAFPARPITLIVPFPAGGVTDVQFRALAQIAQKDPGVAKTLHDAFRKAAFDPLFQKVLDNDNQAVIYMDAEACRKYALERLEEERKIVAEFGLAQQ